MFFIGEKGATHVSMMIRDIEEVLAQEIVVFGYWTGAYATIKYKSKK